MKKEKYIGVHPIVLEIPVWFYNQKVTPKLFRKELESVEKRLEDILSFKRGVINILLKEDKRK
jgi:hypothetical protein